MAFRWGIVGYGWVARDYVAPAMLREGHVVAAVADPDEATRNLASEQGAKTYSTSSDMFVDAELDGVYIATPNHLHAEPTVAALNARIPVLCEKPMAANLADAERMAQAAQDTGVLYGTAFDQRHHPAHLALADQIASGAIGQPTAIRIVYACWVDPRFAPSEGHDNWRIDAAKAGGGAVIDLALHGLDLAQFLLSESLTDLSITLQRRVHDYAVDDGGICVARTGSQVLVTSHTAYNCPEGLPRRRLEVVGDKGMLVATDTMGQTAGGSLEHMDEHGKSRTIEFDTDRSPFAAQVAAFAAAVRGEPHGFEPQRDLALMRLFDTAHREAVQCL